jgi:acyl carrier protein
VSAADQTVRDAFINALDLPAGSDVEALEIGKNPEWDSVGHMALVAELEDRFGVSLEIDEIVGISSYANTVETLRTHGIEV